MNMKTRKLYEIRVHTSTCIYGKRIGYKGRLLPRNIAARIANRLRKDGHDIEIFPVKVNLTNEQAIALDNRYKR